MSDTIFALASGTGRAGVAIIRASGPHAWEGLAALTQNEDAPPPREAKMVTLRQNVSRGTIDHALIIGFKAPASYTGEDIIEYHIHGGLAIIQELLAELTSLPHHRMALPGEFTRRAFENDKMDLTGAEALADLINAETQAQKSQALAQMEGSLAKLYDQWTNQLTKNLAYIEAEIEFPDEDLPKDIVAEMRPTTQTLINEINKHLHDNRRGERLRSGIQVAIIGAPNAGKSSLVNALTQRDVAIVSDIAGTTRDVIEAHLDLGGYPVILSDTAGLRPDQITDEDQDKIESEGIRRALTRAREADIKLLLFDGTQEELDTHTSALVDEKALLVINKTDQDIKLPNTQNMITISAKTGDGLNALTDALLDKIKDIMGESEAPALTRARHRKALEECNEHLQRALNASLPELLAEDIRLATRSIGQITGTIHVEDLLDVIFRDFCIGK